MSIALKEIFAYDDTMSRQPDERSVWPPRIQVAGVSSLVEALFCKKAGADAVGFTLGLPDGPHDGLTTEKAATIIGALPPRLLSVVITYLGSAKAACELAMLTQPAAMQFHGGMSDKEVVLFRSICPGVRIIGRVTVLGKESLEEAASFRPPLWDVIILDSFDPCTGRKGATGLTHDWSISAKIVKIASVPVILAGGLNPGNVAEAIHEVRTTRSRRSHRARRQ